MKNMLKQLVIYACVFAFLLSYPAAYATGAAGDQKVYAQSPFTMENETEGNAPDKPLPDPDPAAGGPSEGENAETGTEPATGDDPPAVQDPSLPTEEPIPDPSADTDPSTTDPGTVASGSWNGLQWTVGKDGSLIIEGDGEMGDQSTSGVSPWAEYSGQVHTVTMKDGVTTIAANAFSGFANLTQITIPSTVKSIGERAFYGCVSLSDISIPASVTDIGEYAFSGCTALQSVALPAGMTVINRETFSYCSGLTTVTIPYGMTEIGRDAFNSCTSLSRIYMPNTVTKIGTTAFLLVDKSPTDVYYAGTKVEWEALLSAYPSTDLEEASLHCDAYARGEWYGLDWVIDLNGALTVSGTGENGLMHSVLANTAWRQYLDSITSATIMDGVRNLGAFAFYGCSNLTSVTLPVTISEIGRQAFYQCEKLTSVTIQGPVTQILEYTFYECTGLTEFTIPEGVVSIDKYAFNRCYNLETITIPASMKTIGDSAFGECRNLKDVYYGGTEARWNKVSKTFGNEWLSKATIHYTDPCPSWILPAYRIDTAYGIDLSDYQTAGERIEIKVLDDTVAYIPSADGSGGTVSEEVTFSLDGGLPYAVSLITAEDAATGNTQVYENGLMVPKVDYDLDNGVPAAGSSHTVTIHPSKLETLGPGRWAAVFHYVDSATSTAHYVYMISYFNLMKVASSVSIDAVNFPDANFRGYVSDSFDLDGNALLDAGEIAQITNVVCNGRSISSLRGVEYFWALERLNCGDNLLTALDLSGNPLLKTLLCGNNELASLELRNNPKLASLEVYSNHLSTLDLSNLPELSYLNFNGNGISSIDLRSNPNLEYLICQSNGITALDLGANTALIDLNVYDNQLASLDVGMLPDLTRLWVHGNQLTELDISNCPLLLDALREGDLRLEGGFAWFKHGSGMVPGDSTGTTWLAFDETVNLVNTNPVLRPVGSSVHAPTSEDVLRFFCSAAIQEMYVGGQMLSEPDQCSRSADGKTISLHPALLNLLRPGNRYTLSVYPDGIQTSAEFSIGDCLRLVPGVPVTAGSIEPLYFSAPQYGYYNFGYEGGDTRYELQILDPRTGSWRNEPSTQGRWFQENESIYLRASYPEALVGRLSVLAWAVTPPAQDSIEVGDPLEVTNCSMTLPFTVSVTAGTADSGYNIGLLWGPDPSFAYGGSRTTFRRAVAVRNNEQMSVSFSNYVPGQEFYYKAILMDLMGNILTECSTVHHVQLDSDLTGFEQLTLGTPRPMTNIGLIRFYFEAPVDGVYAVEGIGLSSINIKENGGYPVGASMQRDSLFGTPIKAGQRIYIAAAQSNGQTGSVAVYAGLQKLPAAVLGTQSVEEQALGGRRIPLHFTAPADGEYSFTTNSMAYMSVMDEAGNDLYHRGIYYRTPLRQGQIVWIDGMERAPGDTLTIVHEALPLRKLAFPAELTHLEDEACRGLLIDEVVFGENIRSIGSLAFADCPDLKRVVIPAADVEIADDAFENSDVILYAPIGGSVEQYAVKHGIFLEAMME